MRRTSKLQLGDRVEANIRGISFTGTITSKLPGSLGIEPDEPKRFSWRFVTPRQVVRRLDRQERLA
jgi:hypothetical protein